MSAFNALTFLAMTLTHVRPELHTTSTTTAASDALSSLKRLRNLRRTSVTHGKHPAAVTIPVVSQNHPTVTVHCNSETSCTLKQKLTFVMVVKSATYVIFFTTKLFSADFTSTASALQ